MQHTTNYLIILREKQEHELLELFGPIRYAAYNYLLFIRNTYPIAFCIITHYSIAFHIPTLTIQLPSTTHNTRGGGGGIMVLREIMVVTPWEA